jgi:hypothetical protein
MTLNTLIVGRKYHYSINKLMPNVLFLYHAGVNLWITLCRLKALWNITLRKIFVHNRNSQRMEKIK